MKTWFANARRRIHKGGDLIPAKRGSSNYVMKEHHDDNDLTSHNAANGVCGNVSLPSDPVSSHNLVQLLISSGRGGQVLWNIWFHVYPKDLGIMTGFYHTVRLSCSQNQCLGQK